MDTRLSELVFWLWAAEKSWSKERVFAIIRSGHTPTGYAINSAVSQSCQLYEHKARFFSAFIVVFLRPIPPSGSRLSGRGLMDFSRAVQGAGGGTVSLSARVRRECMRALSAWWPQASRSHTPGRLRE